MNMNSGDDVSFIYHLANFSSARDMTKLISVMKRQMLETSDPDQGDIEFHLHGAPLGTEGLSRLMRAFEELGWNHKVVLYNTPPASQSFYNARKGELNLSYAQGGTPNVAIDVKRSHKYGMNIAINENAPRFDLAKKIDESGENNLAASGSASESRVSLVSLSPVPAKVNINESYNPEPISASETSDHSDQSPLSDVREQPDGSMNLRERFSYAAADPYDAEVRRKYNVGVSMGLNPEPHRSRQEGLVRLAAKYQKQDHGPSDEDIARIRRRQWVYRKHREQQEALASGGDAENKDSQPVKSEPETDYSKMSIEERVRYIVSSPQSEWKNITAGLGQRDLESLQSSVENFMGEKSVLASDAINDVEEKAIEIKGAADRGEIRITRFGQNHHQFYSVIKQTLGSDFADARAGSFLDTVSKHVHSYVPGSEREAPKTRDALNDRTDAFQGDLSNKILSEFKKDFERHIQSELNTPAMDSYLSKGLSKDLTHSNGPTLSV